MTRAAVHNLKVKYENMKKSAGTDELLLARIEGALEALNVLMSRKK